MLKCYKCGAVTKRCSKGRPCNNTEYDGYSVRVTTPDAAIFEGLCKAGLIVCYTSTTFNEVEKTISTAIAFHKKYNGGIFDNLPECFKFVPRVCPDGSDALVYTYQYTDETVVQAYKTAADTLAEWSLVFEESAHCAVARLMGWL